jgi:hypothetical protein
MLKNKTGVICWETRLRTTNVILALVSGTVLLFFPHLPAGVLVCSLGLFSLILHG